MTIMNDEARLVAAEMRARIALATAAAVLVAGVILVAAVLPAEYGVDPLGTGTTLGLTGLAAVNDEAPPAATGEVPQELEPTRPGANNPQSVPLKQDQITFTVGPREGLEYKYRMEKGAAMVYRWRATGDVRFDFHGEPEGAPKGYAESYQMSEGREAAGSFFAPTPGIHGWFWENLTREPITITLTSTGFYASATEFRAEGATQHELANR